MKTTLLILLTILLNVNIGLSQNFKEIYFKFIIEDKSEINDLTKIISIDKVIGDTIYAYSTDKKIESFINLGYKYSVIENTNSTKATVATTIAEMANWDKYPTYDLYVEMMNKYVTDFPDICKLIEIGTTVNGRKLLALKISDNVNIEENEPEFFYSSTMHGDETTGFPLMLRLIDSLVTNYSSVSEITNLVNDIEIFINPNANPDGTYGSDNSTISYPTRSNWNGFDLNRNFPDVTDGPHPNEQPETKAMMSFANQHRFVLSANFHGGIELANYPWDHTGRRHPDDIWFIRVSEDYATSCQNNSPAGYFDDYGGFTNGYDWYYAPGTRQDYYTYFQNSREITLEISNTKTGSASDLPKYWNYNKEALFQFLRESLYGIKGTVKDPDGNPLDAMIWIQDHDTNVDSSMIFTDPDVGDYHRPIEAGTYNVIASAIGYYTDTIYNISVTDNNFVIANFELNNILTLNQTSITDSLYYNENKEIELIFNKSIEYESLDYNIEIDNLSNKPWISLNKTSGILNSDIKDTIVLTLNALNVESGIFNFNLNITNPYNHLAQIPINITVKDTVEAFIISELINDTLTVGDSSEHKFIIKNIGNQDLEYTVNLAFATKSGEWIHIDRENGIITIEEVDTIKTKLFALEPGTYDCKLIVKEQDDEIHEFPINLFVESTQSVSILSSNLNNFNVYPNPFNKELNIEFYSRKSEKISITIYDLCGNKIFKKYFNTISDKNSIIIETKNLNNNKFAKGIYLIQLSNGAESITKRILKN